MSTTEFPPERPEAYLERVLATWVGRLRLSHWDIAIDWKKSAEDDNLAEHHTSDTYDISTIRVALGSFRDWGAEETNRTIVHELVHILLRDLDVAVRSVEQPLRAGLFDLFLNRFEHETEGAVERIARALIDLGGIV